ncbi:MAG: hypothetical protein JKX85_00035 [Phycisphaeraceae bacterium]|nr:hypothetical protein [Phycisphaeraceae bacterium]
MPQLAFIDDAGNVVKTWSLVSDTVPDDITEVVQWADCVQWDIDDGLG